MRRRGLILNSGAGGSGAEGLDMAVLAAGSSEALGLGAEGLEAGVLETGDLEVAGAGFAVDAGLVSVFLVTAPRP